MQRPDEYESKPTFGRSRAVLWELCRKRLRTVLFNPVVTLTLAFAALRGLAIANAATPSPATTEWIIKTWETENGLPENSATAMVQDSQGYLWFGTFKGLVRFDGDHFTVFDHLNTPGLPSDGIVNLHLDRAGRLWVSTLSELVVRDGSNWRIVRLPSGSDYIRTFTERPNGDLLLTTFGGKVLEFTKGQLSELPSPPGAPGKGYFGAVDEDGHWWVAQSKFVGRWDGKRWEQIVGAEGLRNAMETRIGFAPARDGSLWLLINTVLRKYSRGVEVYHQELPESPGNIWSMMADSRDDIWICTIEEGICELLPNGHMLRWTEDNGVAYHSTRFAFEDPEKDIWIGTSGGGLQRFKPRRFWGFGPESGLTDRVVKSVAPAPGGGVWIGTYGGGLFKWTEKGITNVSLPGVTNNHLYVQSVLTDRKGRTWVGTYGLGLFMFNLDGCLNFPMQQTGGSLMAALFEDSRGRIWTSGGKGLAVYDAGAFHVYSAPEEVPLGGACCFGEDSDKHLWLSDLERVCRFDGDRFVEIMDHNRSPLHGVVCMKGDANGTMWMGSIGTGLLRWKHGSISRISEDEGLPVPNVQGILEDEQGFFWMASNRGVMRAQRRDLEAVADGASRKLACQLLDANDGMPGVECPGGLQPICARDNQGRFWFATSKGAAMTEPSRFHAHTMAPLAVIESLVYFTASGGASKSEHVGRHVTAPFPPAIELPAGSHGLEIHYTSPSFSSPQKVRFQIKLDSRDLEWQEVGNRRVAYFEELPAGMHVFQVRAANDDGLWNETGASLAFTVFPFFWQTSWFQGLLIACLCGMLAAVLYRLKTSLERRHAAQESFTRQLILSQEKERHRVASELHDGLGQDLLLIKNRLRMAAEKASPELASQLLEISTTASQAIAEVRTISHALRPSALEQVGVTKAIEWMVEQIAQTSKGKYSSELENIDGLLAPDMEINLYRIVQEALNNVIKHAKASEVIVQVAKKPGFIIVGIFDNGQGFAADPMARNGKTRQGFGLTNMEERAKVLGGKLELQSAQGTGTRLTLHVPL